MTHVIVLGAGMAGLAAAAELSAAGCEVTLVDKGRSVGGRLATRRIGNAVLDHGAQFFTTRGAAFTDFVARAVAAGVVVEWCRGFGTPDGYPRYRGARGMTSLAKWMAQGHTLITDTEIELIVAGTGGATFVDASGSPVVSGDAAILTAPIPQTVALLDRSELLIPAPLDAKLRRTHYFATLALLTVIEGEANIAEPGGMQFETGPFTFIADNHRKGVSPVRALTFHAEHDYSRRRYDDDTDEVLAELLALAAPWIGASTVVDAQLKKWRYAGPVEPIAAPTETFEAGSVPIALAGDAFAGPKVEGAFNSGIAAARALLGR